MELVLDYTRKILSKANEASTVKVFGAYPKISRKKLKTSTPSVANEKAFAVVYADEFTPWIIVWCH